MTGLRDEEYDEIYRIDAHDEWVNGAYDEDGNDVACDICGEELRWDPATREWRCPGCGQALNRAEYLNYIGANPPGSDCLTSCQENYPFCKKTCERYEIDPEDPLLD